MDVQPNFWKKIWDEKGRSDSTDLLYLCGWEHLGIPIDSKMIVDKIISKLDIKSGDSILEVGCGAGFLSREFKDFDYVGVDYSSPLIEKHKVLFPSNKVLTSEANNLPFEDSSFDFVFASGLFQYLPTQKYAYDCIDEMDRVGKKSIMLVDLKLKPTRPKHFCFEKDTLRALGFSFSKCFYDENSDNYNATRKVMSK